MQTHGLKIFLASSCAGHLVAFSALALANFSLASAPVNTFFRPAVYCGIMPLEAPQAILIRQPLAGAGPGIVPYVPQGISVEPVPLDCPFRPPLEAPYSTAREPLKSPPVISGIPRYPEPAFTLHPLLPYRFDLYFKDRQQVHIELEFSVTRSDSRNFVSLRRKISSGNLEADLLSMRYIGHYLFIQQARFSLGVWQPVKIEFSPNTRDYEH